MTALEPGLRTTRPATAFLPYTPESARAARRLVADKLAEWGLDHLVEDAQLIVSELVANSVRYTGCQRRMAVTIRRRTPQTVRVAVRDSSRTLPVLINADTDAERGRGLAMVAELSKNRLGVEPDTIGKTVWADLGP